MRSHDRCQNQRNGPKEAAGETFWMTVASDTGRHFRPLHLVYPGGVKALLALAHLLGILSGESPQSVPPRFEDYPIREIWQGPPAPLKLTTRSDRMFKTQLTNTAKEPPNFAGRFRMAYWGCGPDCAAAALIHLRSGDVFAPLMANSAVWDRISRSRAQ